MNQGTVNQGITLSQILLPIAAFILGSWLVPKMEWISNTIRIWIFAFGIGLFIFAILITGPVQQQLSKWISNHTFMLSGIILLSLVIFITAGLFMVNAERKHEGRDQLRTTTESLVAEMIQFVSDRELSGPMATAEWDSPDEWFQKSREYSTISDNLFATRYQQRILAVGNDLFKLNIITREELDHLTWEANIGYSRSGYVQKDLMEYCSRLK